MTGFRASSGLPHFGQKADLRKYFSIVVPVLLGSALLLSAGTVSAGENGALSEGVYLEDVPVVLGVSRLSQPVDEAPAAVTIIDRQMIRDSGAGDLAEVFRLVPGMYVAYHASTVYTTNSTVSYHGLSDAYAHRMQVLVDGRSVYSPLFGGVLWDDIPLALDDIERIEVIRGPNSASFGANSFLGAINITTRHSAETQGKFISLSAGRGHNEAVTRYGGGGGNFTWRMTAGMRNDAGEDTRIFDPVSNDAKHGTNKQDNKRIRQLNLRADYQLDTHDELELQFGYNGGMREEGFIADDFYTRRKHVANHFQLVHWSRHLDAGGELSVQFYHGYEESNDTLLVKPASTPPPNTDLSYGANVEAHRYDLEIQHTFSPSDTTRLVWGGSVRLDSTYWPLYLNRQDAFDFHLARLFGNLEWRTKPNLLVNLGAMAEHNDFTGTDVTPRAAVNWHFVPGHTLRASHSLATRTPTLYEQKADNRYYVPLPVPYDLMVRHAVGGLKPEHIKSTEIGYIGKLSGFDTDLRLYHDELNNLISQENYNPCNPTGTLPTLGGFVLPPNVPAGLTAPGVACYGADSLSSFNNGSAIIKGLEMQFQWRPGDRTRLMYGFSHSIVSSLNGNNQPYTNSVPTNSHSLMLAHSLDAHWSGSLTGYHMGEVRALGGVDMVAAYERWDGRLAYRFISRGGNGELALMVKNLFDDRHFEYETVNQPPGRTAWLNLKLDL